MRLNPKQKNILKYYIKEKPKHLILHGAVRSGKTFEDNILFLYLVHKNKGQRKNYIITGHTVGSVERNVLMELREQTGIKITLDKYNSFNLSGNRVFCFGAERSDSYMAITGMTAHGWYGNELTLQHNNTIQECFSRVSGEDSFILWDTNPDYPEHPIKKDYIDQSGAKFSTGRTRLKAFHFQLEDNHYLPQDYIENLKATTPKGMWYDRKIKGLWVAAEGIVFENWDRNIHVIEPFEISGHWKRYRSIDWGYTNPFCCLWFALDEDNRVYVYKEHYKSQMLIKDHAAIINAFVEYKDKENRIEYINTIADHDAQDNAEIREHGIYTKNARKEKLVSIQKLAERLVIQRDGKPRFYVFNTCENTIREMGLYRWQDHKEGRAEKEEPLKLNDHSIDCILYFLMEIDKGEIELTNASAYLGF